MTTRHIAALDVTGALGYTPVRLPGLSSGLTRTGIVIPYYVYVANPYNDTNFNSLLVLIRTHPTVPVVIVVNQAGIDGLGGPGPYDAAMAQMIRMLRAAGAAVCGYVSTQSATRAAALVQADITSWNALYPSTPLDGVFFDEVPYAVGTANANITLYKSYYDYAHAAGYGLVIGNPGTQLLHDWYDTRVADIYVCYENTSWPALSAFSIAPPSYISGATTDYLIDQFAVLVYNSSWSQSGFDALSPFFGWIYATDNPSPASLSVPWAALPSYLSTLFTAAANTNATIATITGGTITGGTITGGTIDGTPIGATTPAAASFTTLAASSAAFSTLAASSAVTYHAPPALITTTTYTVAAADLYLIFNGAATCTVTLPAASGVSGRVLSMKTVAAFTVVSASSNVKPRTSNTAGTAILAAVAGSWAHLISDGTNWVVMAGA